MKVSPLAVAVAALVVVHARAASFDCAKAATRAEKAICGAEKDCVDHSTARTYATTVPAPGLVSVCETLMDDEQGAAHPEVSVTNDNWWLSRSGRVTAADMFSGSGWKAVIENAARAYAKKQNERVKLTPDAIDGVSTPDAWSLTTAALVLTADGYAFELGRGQHAIEVPWRDSGATLRPEFAAALQRR